ncbi:hypothetical protein D6825_03020 [Candidatus Woesearchaeota archaeon]|nr:MAG: hypothetical protein D6825_03020 [Candidatus Woesearchaeota archaeon]
MIEQFLDSKTVQKHFSFILAVSIANVFIAKAAQWVYFPTAPITLVLFVTILLLPSLHHLIVVEEKLERKGSANFLKKHKTVFYCYFGAFIGTLIGFAVIGALSQSNLSFQSTQLLQEHLSTQTLLKFKQFNPTASHAFALFSENLWYILAGFAFSIFYGAGAIVLITYNASFFAAYLFELSKLGLDFWTISVSLTHLLPESAGFILTAIAGATLSRALIVEKLKSTALSNVARNAFLLLLLGISLTFIAAFIETFITAAIYSRAL